MSAHIVLLPGDGIGPEIMESARRVLEAAAQMYDLSLDFTTCLIGGSALDQCGTPLPEETLKHCLHSDAVLLGAVGGPAWDGYDAPLRPESGLLALRKGMQLYANLRPAHLYPSLTYASPLKASMAQNGMDLMIVRELTGGIYFGERGRQVLAQGSRAYDTECYTTDEIVRITRVACRVAMSRNKHVTSIDKANVLETSRLWRQTVHEIVDREFPEITLQDMLVDNCAMQLIRDPAQFDVLLMSNLFGDILSDEASALTGSIGLLPSASFGDGTRGLYEPIHGSAPALAGKNLANPIGMILSGAMMLRYSLQLPDVALCMEQAVEKALEDGFRTADLVKENENAISTSCMTDQILHHMKSEGRKHV